MLEDFAFNLLSDSSLLLLFNVGIPILSTFGSWCTTIIFSVSQNKWTKCILSISSLCIDPMWFSLFGKHFVTCWVPALFMRVECSLFKFVHSFDSSIYPRCFITLRYYFSWYVTVNCWLKNSLEFLKHFVDCVPGCVPYSTGIIRFFTKQIATEGFSAVFGQSRFALWHTKSIKPRKFGNIVKMRLENEKSPYSPHVKSCVTNYHRFSKKIS